MPHVQARNRDDHSPMTHTARQQAALSDAAFTVRPGAMPLRDPERQTELSSGLWDKVLTDGHASLVRARHAFRYLPRHRDASYATTRSAAPSAGSSPQGRIPPIA